MSCYFTTPSGKELTARAQDEREKECHLPRANLMPVTIKVCWPSTDLLLLTKLDKRVIPVTQTPLNSVTLKHKYVCFGVFLRI